MRPFTHARYEALRRRYDLAVASDEQQFIFDGHELLTAYAKYLLMYLAEEFDREPSNV